MAKVRAVFRCSECGATAPKWVGRCPGCEEWNSLVEELDVPAGQSVAERLGPRDVPVPISEVDVHEWSARATGISELDRVLGGGLVPGSVTLVGGEPGIGKSTLLLQAVASIAADGAKVLYVSAEESKQQVRLRAERLGTLRPSLWLASETSLPHILDFIDEIEPDRGGGRLHPDRAPPRHRLGAGLGVAGARVRRPPRHRGQVAAASPSSWSATSPRRAASPGPACSSTSSTPCWPSRATATTPCACCGR